MSEQSTWWWWRRRSAQVLVLPALIALTAYWIYRLTDDDDDDDDYLHLSTTAPSPLPPPPPVPCATPPRAARRPSFDITNEHGEVRGSLEDASASGWGWQVQEKPLAVTTARPSVPPPALRHSKSHEEMLARQQEVGGQKRSVRFRLDRTGDGDGFYGFVFDFSGRCVAHGADETFVGLTLPEVLARTQNGGVDGAQLHRRFVAAAEAGGGWVSYPWRNAAHATIQHKGAYVIKVSQ